MSFRFRHLVALLVFAAAASPVLARDAEAQARRPVRRASVARDTVRVCAGGDVTLGTNLDTAWVHTARQRLGYRVPALPDPAEVLEPLRPLLQDADVVLWNVEGAIGEGRIHRRKCAPGSTACFAFRSPVAAAAALRGVSPESAAVVGNVANNHARDDGLEGRAATIRHLRDAGIRATGADTLATVAVTPAGDTVAFLGFSQWSGPDPRNLAAVRRHVRRAAERYPRLVVTMHMGAEGRGATRTPNRSEIFYDEDRGNVVAFARAAAAAGADLVVGHGPHVMRAAEWHSGALIFYSLGNLATYGPFSLGEPLNRGAIACAVLDRDGRVVSAELRPTRQAAPGRVRPDASLRAAVLVDSLGVLDFPGTAARVDPQTGALRRPGAGTPAEALPGTRRSRP
ncbi:MAG TPA: CapA family protein [Longimicrobium sp.]|nr:CapA family protein [Longimicrobium sp.]